MWPSLTHPLLRGQRYAVPLTMLVSILPLVNWFAWVMLAFVAVCRGGRASLPVLLAVMLPQTLMVNLVLHDGMMTLQLITSGLFLWVGAVCWHHLRSWVLVLEVLLLCASVIIVLAHMCFPELSHFWRHFYSDYWPSLNQLSTASGWWQEYSAGMLLALEKNPQVITFLTHIATGVSLAGTLLATLVQLLLAQHWEQCVFNKTEWKHQLKSIRLSRSLALMACVLVGLACSGLPVAQDLLPVWCVVFALAGLSLFHAQISRRKRVGMHYRVRLAALYTLLVLLLVYAFFGLIVLALVDSALNLRSRWLSHNQLKQTL